MMRKLVRLTGVLSLSAALTGAVGAVHAQGLSEPGPRQQSSTKEPIVRLFELYVLDVVGHLPPAQLATLESMNLQRALKTRAADWRGALRESLHLSSTIDIAILDLWYANGDTARAKGVEYSAQQFAADFVVQYRREGSRVDVWPSGALDAARERINARRSQR